MHKNEAMMNATMLCTPKNPYTKERAIANPGLKWSHWNAKECESQINEQGATVMKVMCTTCGSIWTEDFPQ